MLKGERKWEGSYGVANGITHRMYALRTYGEMVRGERSTFNELECVATGSCDAMLMRRNCWCACTSSVFDIATVRSMERVAGFNV